MSVAKLSAFVRRRVPSWNGNGGGSMPDGVVSRAVLAAFRLADRDGSGWVERGEARGLLRAALPRALVLARLLDQVDADASAALTLDEFLPRRQALGLGDLSPSEAAALFRLLDEDCSGRDTWG